MKIVRDVISKQDTILMDRVTLIRMEVHTTKLMEVENVVGMLQQTL